MFVKYWGYLLAKLTAAGGVLWFLRAAIAKLFPKPSVTVWNTQQDLFGHDLGYTAAMMGFFLIMSGILYVVIWDQRYRCRTCLRRLRMPVMTGSWPNMFLKGQPRLEYICIYGHGTLKVPEVDLGGPKAIAWQPHDEDIWKELEALGVGDRR